MDLTRRALIGRAAAASGALLGASLLAPDVVFAGQEGEAVFQMRLPRSGRAGARWHSGVVEAPRQFELIGVEAGGDPGIEVRARGLDGRWSGWLPLHAGRGHAPDAPEAATPSRSALSDPVWTGRATAYELRAGRPLHDARVLLVDAGHGASAAGAKQLVATGLPAGAGQPAVLARATWATSACRPRVPAVFGAVELAFVHHTVSSNAYRPSQSAAMVRAICLFHKYGNGWNDIGYNFVVDRYGQIFEGRAGGIDETVVGAHAGGYNVYSTGVALLGTFSGGGPPRRAFDSLTRLLAWKLGIHGVQAPGATTVVVTQDGSGYSRYRAGVPVRLNLIAGHRDADTTECPGSGMYRQLPRLRQAAERIAGTVSALTLESQAAAPASVTLGGILTQELSPIAGAPVELQLRSSTRGPATLAYATTGADGAWSATVSLAQNADVRALYRGDATHSAVASPGLIAAVPPLLTLTAAAQQVAPGGVIEFTGATAPAKPRVAIVLAQQQPDGTLITTRTIQVRTAADGSFDRTIGFPDPGQYQVVAHTTPDEANALGTSAPIAITVG